MSEVIEDYIRRHPSASLQESLNAFLREERIRSWVDGDPIRRDRIQREFARVWATIPHDSGLATAQPARATAVTKQETRPAPKSDAGEKTPRSGPAGPAVVHSKPLHTAGPVTLPAPGKVEALPPQPAHATLGRKLKVLCTTCGAFAVHSIGTRVSCHKCGTTHEDMLRLIPVAPVGPFAFTFGTGWKGYVRAAALALFLAGLYGVFRWS